MATPVVQISQSRTGRRKRAFVGQLFERQPTETDGAWNGFTVYRDQGHERSVIKTAEYLSVPRATVATWSSKWLWPRRIEAWDLWLDRAYALEMASHRRAMARKHIKLAERIQQVALLALQKKYGNDLSQVTAESFDNDQLLKWLLESTKMERQAVGMPATQGEETNVNSSVPDSDRVPSAVALPATTDERLAAALAILDAVRARSIAVANRTADRLAVLPTSTVLEATDVSRD